MYEFKWIPDQEGTTAKAQPKIRLVTFGDGYEQRQKNGINHDLRSYSLSFTGDADYIKEILDFLEDRGGVEAFIWKAPDKWINRTFKATDWSYPLNGIWETITVTVQEVVA
ncbi:phage tail protein [Sodalis sp. RH22]|uniref:phage tail protein n=1 Tax=unclassified Sodalis (in: enterobacteria) TaxID=2636512 RepID=UPI0039B4AF98